MIIDIAFLLFIIAGFYWGFRSGVIYSIFSVVGLFLGVIAALKFSYLAVNLLHGWLNVGPKALVAISFVLVLVLVVLLFKFIAWGLERLLQSFALDIPNKVGGGIVYALAGAYLFCILIWFTIRLQVLPDGQKKDSFFYSYIAEAAPKVVEASGKIVPMFKDAFKNFDDLFGSGGHKH